VPHYPLPGPALKKATTAYNEKSHTYLMGSAPNDVKGSEELQYELDKIGGEQIKHNNNKWRQRAGKLRDAGAFRIPRPRDTWERVDAPKIGGEVFNVDGFKGGHVESGTNSYPVKTSLGVPAGSAAIEIGIEGGAGGGRRARQKEMLQDYARNLKSMLPTIGYTLARVAQILRGMRGFQDTTDTYGPAKQGRIVSFLKLYPNYFAIQGSGPSIKVLPAAAPEPRPARPVQVGGASSSSGSGERQPRAVETDARAPYRKFPNDQRVRFEDNPGRPGGPRWVRFEKYKEATTIGGARRLGATSQDISMDVAAGALVLL
jgi:hypothetical protein